jgi:hypothetical protein
MTMYNRSEISTMMALQHEEGVKRQTEMGEFGVECYVIKMTKTM